MTYFVTESERKKTHSTCFFEFQKGKFESECWKEDSLCLSDDIFEEYKLYNLFSQVLDNFDKYGITVVDRLDWNRLQNAAEELNLVWRKIIIELTPWAEECFKEYDEFSILGI